MHSSERLERKHEKMWLNKEELRKCKKQLLMQLKPKSMQDKTKSKTKPNRELLASEV